MNFTFIDLFAGIGGFRYAIANNGGHCLHFSEIDKNAINTYCINSNEPVEKNLGDITKIKALPPHNLLTAGVPCQSWSIAGKKLGFNDDRGQLWNDTIYLLNQSQPDAFIFENVKGLADQRNKEALSYIMDRIKLAGYHANYYVINSLDYGVLQHRERIYIIGFKNKHYADLFKLPPPVLSSLKLRDIITDEPNVLHQDFNIDGFNDYFVLSDVRNGIATIHSWDIIQTTQRQKNICILLLTNRRKSLYGNKDGNPMSYINFLDLDPSISINELDDLVSLNIFKKIDDKYDFKNSKVSTGINGIYRIFLPSANLFPTLVASDSNDFITNVLLTGNNIHELKENFINNVLHQKNYRKISKQEACVIQGFPINYILPDNRSNWIKQIGNSVSIPVIDSLVKAIINTGVFNVLH
jgi:DNA (cytosine-5)-methyltransferase 1